MKQNDQSTVKDLRRHHLFPARLNVDEDGDRRQRGLTVSVPESGSKGVQVRSLAESFVLCSWARNVTLTVPLSTQYAME